MPVARKLKGKDETIAADFRNGMSVPEIAAKHLVTPRAIYAALKRNGYAIKRCIVRRETAQQ